MRGEGGSKEVEEEEEDVTRSGEIGEEETDEVRWKRSYSIGGRRSRGLEKVKRKHVL